MTNRPLPPNLRVAAYLPRSRVNGPGLRAVLWVQGCPLRCPGCFNPAFLPFAGGREQPADQLLSPILADPDTEGLTLSGGEPFSQAAALAWLAERVQAAGKGVLIFTGRTARALRADPDPAVQRLLAAADLLVAGPYGRHRPLRHPLLASANQELVYLSGRYRGRADADAPRRVEVRVGMDGVVTRTGFPVASGEAAASRR